MSRLGGGGGGGGAWGRDLPLLRKDERGKTTASGPKTSEEAMGIKNKTSNFLFLNELPQQGDWT